MKKIAILLLVLLLFTGCIYNSPGDAVATKPIRISALLPLTGVMAIYGEAQKHGLEMAIEEINENKMLSRKLQLSVEDNASDPKTAVSAATKILNVDKSSIMFSTMTPTTQPILPLLMGKKVLLMIGGSISPKLAMQSKYFFRDYANVYDWADVLAESAMKEGSDKLGLIVFQTEQGELFIDEFQKKFSQLNGSITTVERFPIEESDFRQHLLKVKSSGAKGIVFAGYPKNNSLLIKQLYELNLPLKAYMINAAWPEVTADIEAANVVQPTTAWFSFDKYSSNPATKRFFEQFKQKYGKEPDQEAAYSYDSINAIAIALKNCNENELDSDCLADYLLQMKDYDGAAGRLSFNKDGDSIRQSTVMKFIDGAWIKHQ